MKQLFNTEDGAIYSTISTPPIPEISRRIRVDIAFLRENLEVITEDNEKKLVWDIERFLFEDIAGEIRLSLYDPLQNNRVYMEYCYKVDQLSSDISDDAPDNHLTILNLPETCLFDIFIFFTERFAGLKPELQKEILKDYNLDWYDLNFNLKYNKKNKRKKAGGIDSEGLSINRYIYESPIEENINTDSVNNNVSFHTMRADAKKTDKFEEELANTIQCEKKINYVIYRDLEGVVDSIKYVLHQQNKIVIRWSLSRGFIIDSLSNRYESDDVKHIRDVKNPASALNFIIENKEERVSYIFEDFHHHIGGAQAFNTTVAEIRSLIRDISRVLRDRDEYVFFLSPTDSLPIELVPVFNLLKQETGKKNTSFLERYGYTMTDTVLCSRNKPLIGRDDKVKRVIQILCQMETNNPLLVGGAGVGKTALVEGLASEIVKGNVPPILKGKTVFSLNMNTLIAGSRYRGDFEERINRLMEEVQSHSRELIVFIDEIHTLLGAGSAEGAAGAEDILKPALARGDFPCIGATTYDGYESLLKDPALARRFQKVDIQPATIKEAEQVLFGVLHIFEKHHDVKIAEDAIKTAVKLSEECIHDQFLPGKAIRLLDSASAFVKLDGRQTVCGNDIEGEIRRTEDR